MDTWHRRMGHISTKALEQLEEHVDSVKLTTKHLEDRFNGDYCTKCKLSSAKQLVSRTPMWKGENPFDKIHLDVVHYPKGYNDDVYLIHFYCAVSSFHYSITIPDKGARTLIEAINGVLNMVKNWGYNTRYLHLDPDSALRDEFDSRFQQYVRDKGLLIDRAPVATKQPNGYAERSGGVVVERARALLIESGLPESLWPACVAHATYLINRTPKKSLNWKTPYELVMRRKPSLASLRIMGSKAYVRKDFSGN
jgi:hypothetical protein